MARSSPQDIRRLVERHWPGMVLFARQWTSEPEDVVQNALVKLFQQLQVPADPVAWMYRVIRNEAISGHRRRRNRIAREAQVASDIVWIASLDDQIDSQHASSALRELPNELREVVFGRIWGQLTFQQIADVCQVSVATVHRRYGRALLMLRDCLQVDLEEPIEDEDSRSS